MTTESDDSPRAEPTTAEPTTASVSRNRPAVRRRRSHAALGSRVFAGGLAVSGTIALAGVIARRPVAIVAPPAREEFLALVAAPRVQPAKLAAGRVRVDGGKPQRLDAVVPAGARRVGNAVVPTTAPATPATSVQPALAPPPALAVPTPVTAPALQHSPPPAVPAPTTPPRPVASLPAPPPVVVAPKAPPVTTSHASPPPP